eukprot:TRINITY_DN3906_c0_g1_i11.p1 TRINITY_DN3906_c0_g1~~TRINITY_DN3906_c0_g1_i11.p1  ORF type:complete len:773 (+),score=198.01 TRINITY_DN3906_c0_g1_i11:164-2482(+)
MVSRLLVVLLLQIVALSFGTTPSTSVERAPHSRAPSSNRVPAPGQKLSSGFGSSATPAVPSQNAPSVAADPNERSGSARPEDSSESEAEETEDENPRDDPRGHQADVDVPSISVPSGGQGSATRLPGHQFELPACVSSCVSKIQACQKTIRTGKPDCACVTAALTRCKPKEKCDEHTLVELSHVKDRACGLAVDDPLIKDARARLLKATEDVPEIAHDENFHPEGPLSRYRPEDDDEWAVDDKPVEVNDKPGKSCRHDSDCGVKGECSALVCVTAPETDVFAAAPNATERGVTETTPVVSPLKPSTGSSTDPSTGSSAGHPSTGSSPGHPSTGSSPGHPSTGSSSSPGHPSTGSSAGHPSTGSSAGHPSTGSSAGHPSTGSSPGHPSTAKSSDATKKLNRCTTKLASSKTKLSAKTKSNSVLRKTLLTLGGAVQAPTEAIKDKALAQYVKKQLKTLTKNACDDSSRKDLGDIDDHPHHKQLKQELANAGKSTRDADVKLHEVTQEHEKLKLVFRQLMSSMQRQDGQPMRAEYWKSSELIEKLQAAVQNGGGVVSANWGDFIDKISEKHQGSKEEGLTDPVAMGMTYGIASGPAILLACLSRFQSVKDFFILQGLLFNCAFSGIFALLAVLAMYCQFNPLKIVVGQPTNLPAFEFVFLGAFVYVAACNIMLVFVQPGAVEKLHGFFSVVVGAHMYWMMYTLRGEDSGLQHLFFSVYFVCFLGCCIAKLRGVAVLHLTSVRRTKKNNNRAIPVKDGKGAVFELGDDLETAGLVD